ncbi:hypothetical protein, partial [Pseudomonas sp. AMR01]|uniref:hypothetical protein n=1 Tax=Pseudomonas sp. AMR01 TaxID=3064904 RepID=UPI0035C050A9
LKGMNAVSQILLGRWFWGRFATQRGASPLATGTVFALNGRVSDRFPKTLKGLTFTPVSPVRHRLLKASNPYLFNLQEVS